MEEHGISRRTGYPGGCQNFRVTCLRGQAVGEHDGEMCERLEPALGLAPFVLRPREREVEQLEDGVVGGKAALGAKHFSKL